MYYVKVKLSVWLYGQIVATEKQKADWKKAHKMTIRNETMKKDENKQEVEWERTKMRRHLKRYTNLSIIEVKWDLWSVRNDYSVVECYFFNVNKYSHVIGK